MLSRHRTSLMGLAILMVVLFHVSVPRQSDFYGLCRLGNVGVDIFLFLSGMGLWFAWGKLRENRLRTYFWRRYSRIYPTWLLVAATFYIMQYPTHKFSKNIVDLAGDILINWDFWLHDELTFWYVPAIMALYTVAPLYLMLLKKNSDAAWLPVVAMVWCCAVQWVAPINQAVGHIEIFWSRVPIFFIGINCGRLVEEKRELARLSMLMMALVFAVCIVTSWWLEQFLHGKFPLFIERMIYIPMTVTGCLLLSMLLEHSPRWITWTLTFLGGLSFEIYLIHSNFFIMWLRPYHLGYWGTVGAVLACTLPVAWLTRYVVSLACHYNDKTR